MANPHRGQRASTLEAVELLLDKRLPLAAAIEMAKEYPGRVAEKPLHRFAVERHRRIMDVTKQLRTEATPDLLQRQPVAHLIDPGTHLLELAPKPFAVGFDLGNHATFASSTQVAGFTANSASATSPRVARYR